jgi:hypothetical protein
MSDHEEKEVHRLTELLDGYLVRVPPAVNAGSYNLSIQFKAAIVAARKVRNRRGVSSGDLVSAINTIDRYWKM